MIPVKLNGVSYQFPTSLKELTLGQWLDLRASTGEFYDIAVLTGLSVTEVKSFKSIEDWKAAIVLLTMLKNSFEDDIKNAMMPEIVTIGDKIIEIPKELNLEPIGAYIAVHDVIVDEMKVYEANGNRFSDDKIILDIVANYLYIHYYGGLFDDEKAGSKDYRDLVKEIKLVDALTIAMFFFRKFPNL